MAAVLLYVDTDKTQIHEVVDAKHQRKQSCNLNGFEVLPHKVTENVEN